MLSNDGILPVAGATGEMEVTLTCWPWRWCFHHAWQAGRKTQYVYVKISACTERRATPRKWTLARPEGRALIWRTPAKFRLILRLTGTKSSLHHWHPIRATQHLTDTQNGWTSGNTSVKRPHCSPILLVCNTRWPFETRSFDSWTCAWSRLYYCLPAWKYYSATSV